jgi:hypothetical protein
VGGPFGADPDPVPFGIHESVRELKDVKAVYLGKSEGSVRRQFYTELETAKLELSAVT